MARTVGELRSELVKLGDKSWTIAAHLRDRDPLPSYGLGGEMSPVSTVVESPPIDWAKIHSRAIANPMLLDANRKALDGTIFGVLEFGVDWRTRWGGHWLATIQDQNPAPSCWAFASAALVETMVRIEHGVWSKRSEGDLRDGWGGASGQNWAVRDGVPPSQHGAGLGDAMNWVTSVGIADPACFPWTAGDKPYTPTADRPGRIVKIPAVTSLASVDDQKKWLQHVGPIAAAFQAFDDFEALGDFSVYAPTSTSIDKGTHEVLIVGYDDVAGAWIIRNSWGIYWGKDGYGRIKYGTCSIDDGVKYGLTLTDPDPWTKRRLHSGNILESGHGASHRNFEMVRQALPRLEHVWRDGDTNAWTVGAQLTDSGDVGAGAACIGQPSLIASTYGRNMETVYWEGSGRLRHWWHDDTTNAWNDGGQFGPTDVEGFPGLIQSNYGAPGNLEVVVRRRGGLLQHWWREGAPSFVWHDGGTITTGVLMSGPSLVQANVGTNGNLYVACVLNDGRLQLWWRDDDNGMAWKPGEVFGSGYQETSACMIQGEYGAIDELTPGNFELCIAANGVAEHWWRDNALIASDEPKSDASTPGKWTRSATFGHDVKHVRGLVQSSFGSNLEVIVETAAGELQHYYRDGKGWETGPIIPV